MGKACSVLLHVKWLCLCSMYSPCPRGFGSRLFPRLRGVYSYISCRRVTQSHLVRHTIPPPPWHSAGCLPQYCGIRCGMGSTLNTSEWWRWFSQGRKKTRLKGHMKDREQYVEAAPSPRTCYEHMSESYLPNQCQYLCTLTSLKAKVLWSVKQKVKSMSWTLTHNTNTKVLQPQHNRFQKDK